MPWSKVSLWRVVHVFISLLIHSVLNSIHKCSFKPHKPAFSEIVQRIYAYAKTGLFQVPSGGLVYELVQKHRQIGYKSEPLLPVNNPPMLKPCSSSSKSINFAYQGNQRCYRLITLYQSAGTGFHQSKTM